MERRDDTRTMLRKMGTAALVGLIVALLGGPFCHMVPGTNPNVPVPAYMFALFLPVTIVGIFIAVMDRGIKRAFGKAILAALAIGLIGAPLVRMHPSAHLETPFIFFVLAISMFAFFVTSFVFVLPHLQSEKKAALAERYGRPMRVNFGGGGPFALMDDGRKVMAEAAITGASSVLKVTVTAPGVTRTIAEKITGASYLPDLTVRVPVYFDTKGAGTFLIVWSEAEFGELDRDTVERINGILPEGASSSGFPFEIVDLYRRAARASAGGG